MLTDVPFQGFIEPIGGRRVTGVRGHRMVFFKDLGTGYYYFFWGGGGGREREREIDV